jgi:hypothetical protein
MELVQALAEELATLPGVGPEEAADGAATVIETLAANPAAQPGNYDLVLFDAARGYTLRTLADRATLCRAYNAALKRCGAGIH